MQKYNFSMTGNQTSTMKNPRQSKITEDFFFHFLESFYLSLNKIRIFVYFKIGTISLN